MRIGIDARLIQILATGDTAYWRALITGLARLPHTFQIILYLDANLPMPDALTFQNLQHRFVRAPSWRLWSLYAFPLAVRKDHPDLVHVQYTIPPGIPCPVVTTVHDVSFKRHPEFFHWKDCFILDIGLRRSAKRAARILAPSEFTKTEIVNLHGIPPDKIAVVYPGVDERFKPISKDQARECAEAKYHTGYPFILAVGVIQPRKNLHRLLQAFAILKGTQPFPHKLVIVGPLGWKETDFGKNVYNLGLENQVILTGYVPADDLPVLYSAADVFVYPSVYEGFGIPPVEAMACGTPVITGNCASLPEVVADAGVMVNPYEPEAFAHAMANVLADDRLRAEMSALGLQRARAFSPDAMAVGATQVYQEVVA